MTRTEMLRSRNFLTSLAPGVQQAATAATQGQRVTKAEADRRMTALLDTLPQAMRDTTAPADLRQRYAPQVTDTLLQESRTRVTEAKRVAREMRAELEAVRREWQRIPEPTIPATADETQRLLHTIVQQNARLEARTRVAHLTRASELFAALQTFETAGDTWAAIETEAALERVLERGPESSDPAALTAWRILKTNTLPAHQAGRIPADVQTSLAEAQQALDAADRDVSGAADVQRAMEHTRTIEIVD